MFSPNDVLPAYSGSLTLTTDDPDVKSIAIGLAGGAGMPQLEVTPNPLNFVAVRANTSTTLPMRVRNTGTGPIDITSISTPSSPFSITAPANLTIRRTLAAGAVLDITVQFFPTAEGSFSGSFNLTTDHTELSSVTVNLSGTAVMPKLELSPSPLVFLDQVVGSASTPSKVVVRNTGTGPVSISNVRLSGSTAFTLTATTVTRFDLLPNGSRELSVVFNPATKADHSATLTLETDVPSPPVTLSGKGISQLVLEPAETVDFGAVNLRNTNKTVTRAIKLTNSSGAQIVLKSISSLSGHPFVVRNLSPKTIAPNEVIIFNVDFTAPGEGPFSAILTLETDASNGPSHQLLLQGVGAYPSGKLILPNGTEIASFDFGGVQSETTKQVTLRFSNDGPVPLVVGKPVMGKTDRVFTYLGPDTLTLQPGTHMDFQVTFRPPLLQSYSDTLTIPSDAKTSPTTVSLLGFGATPEVKLDRYKLFFGDVRVGATSDEVAVTINNTGNSDVTLLGLAVVGPFGVTPRRGPLPVVIPAFSSLVFDVTFKPSEPTPADQEFTTGSVTVITDISNSSEFKVDLSGIGTISVADLPAASLNLQFGSQRVTNASGIQPVIIRNSGAAALEISRLIFSNEAFFLDPAPPMPMTVEAGQQGVVSVRFKPGTLGQTSGTLYIVSNAYVPAKDVVLGGKGVDGRLTMTPSVAAFPSVNVGGAGAQAPMELSNSGEYPLKISTVGTPTDPSFSVMGLPENLVLEPAQKWAFTVSFNPAKRGYFAANTIITSDAVLNPRFSMAMEGTGVSASAELQPTDVNFGSANLNVPTPYDLSIKNAGENDLLVSKINFVEDPASPGAHLDFSVDSGVSFPLTVKAGQSSLVRLLFRPRVIGPRRATAVVFTSVPNGGERRASLLGEGNSSAVGVTHTGLPFGDVLMNSPSEPATINIKNTGTGSLTVKSISLAGPDMAFFTLVKPDPLPVLAAGASVTVSVTLTPPEERTFLAQVLVSTDNADAPNANVELRGSGVRSQIQVEPNPLSFGNQLVYSTSKPRAVTITNNRRDLVNIRSITTEGPFDLVLPTGVRLPYSLEGKLVGEATGRNKLDVGVRIRPQAEGAATGKLRITFTDQVLQPLEVELRGTGIPTALSITPSVLNFGAVRAGGSAQPMTFSINNLTDDEVELGKPVVLNGSTGEPFDYNWALLEGTKIGARSPYAVQVGYKPLVETLSDSTLNFGTKVPEWREAATVQLNGRAVARLLRVDPEDLDFGRVDVGKPMVSKEITITNLSAQPQRVEAKLSTDVPSFVLTTKGLADPIAPGGNAKITLGFKPENAGMVENELRISLQGDSVAEAVIPVHGNGRDLKVSQPGCSTSGTEAGSAGMLMLLALVGLGSRRRRRG
ncbi:MAG TPA: choice-of-anchor D domain-containing protein [Archangium sp.]|nr:choice-of-anchor D domain-containing protein [Archangium sp.]